MPLVVPLVLEVPSRRSCVLPVPLPPVPVPDVVEPPVPVPPVPVPPVPVPPVPVPVDGVVRGVVVDPPVWPAVEPLVDAVAAAGSDYSAKPAIAATTPSN